MVRNDRGQALVLVLLLTTVIFVIGGAAVATGSAARKNATLDLWQKKAYYIAEAGVEKALVKLRGDPTWRDESGEELKGSYGGGRIACVIVQDAAVQDEVGRLVEVVSSGSYREAKRTVKARVLVTARTDLFHGLSILPESPCDAGIYGKFTLDSDEPGVFPRIIVNGDITFHSSGGNEKEIEAMVFSSGKISDKHDRVEDGYEHPAYDAIPPFPPLPSEGWFQENAVQPPFAGDITIGERNGKGKKDDVDLDITQLVENGIYFVKGNVTISGAYTVPATIVATGDIIINDDLRRNNREALLLTLISLNADIEAQGKTDIEAVIVAAGSFEARGKTSVFGSILARGLNKKFAGRTDITTSPSLVERSLPDFLVVRTGVEPDEPYPKIRVRAWTEFSGQSTN